MTTLMWDLRHGWRNLRNTPGFTFVAVLTLALGISVITTVFSWIDGVLLRPFPGLAQPDRLAFLETKKGDRAPRSNMSFLDYCDYRDFSKLAQGLAVARFTPLSLGSGGRPRRAWGELVSANYFDVLGVKPALGRTFTPEEASPKPGASPVVVLSDSLWRSQYRADPKILGRTIRVNRHELTVVGVTPPEFLGTTAGLRYDLWVPLNMAPLMGTGNATLTYRATRDLTTTIARLRPGVTVAQFDGEIQALSARLSSIYPDTNRMVAAVALPLAAGHSGAQELLQSPLRILAAVSVLLLLVVCANVANLLLARGVARQRELSLRLSLGARPGRLIRQLLTETSILAAAGAAGGLILAPWLVHSLGALLPPTDLPVTLAGGIGWRTFAFTVLATVVVTLLCGVVPALVATRSSVSSALQSGQRAGGGRHSHTLRATLVVGEMALASLALVGAGLFLRSFHNASQTDPGFDSRQIDVSSFYLSSAGYSGAEQRKFCLDLRRRLETVPGVAAVGYADQIPLSFGPLPTHPLTVPDYATPPGEDMQISRIFVSPGFVSMLGIRLLDGRDFNEADKAGSPPVMLVSHAFARHFWGDGPAVGRTVLVEKEKYTVVGVTADANYNNLTGPAQPFFYIPFAQRFAPGLNFNVYIKWTGNRPGIAEALRREATALNQDAIYTTLTLAQATASSLYPLRVAATLLAVLGVVCLVLAGLGLYSVMSYSVAQRTRDLGVHIAMGARPVQLVAMVLRNGLTLACAGLLAGFVATWAASSFVGSMLVRVSAMDPSTLAGAGLFLGAVALLANFIPARRALSVQPLDALRSE